VLASINNLKLTETRADLYAYVQVYRPKENIKNVYKLGLQTKLGTDYGINDLPIAVAAFYNWYAFFYLNIGGGVHTGSTRHCGHSWPIVPVPGDCEDGEVGGMNGFGR
jgi:hypothetical protein